MTRPVRVLIGFLAFSAALSALGIHDGPRAAKRPVPRVIALDAKGEGYLRLLGGPPETATMRSGLVTLAPQKSVGRHNTEDFEEMIVVLEGRGEMKITGGETLEIAAGFAVYCPPHTEHDVRNTGEGPLRYIYVVAIAPKS